MNLLFSLFEQIALTKSGDDAFDIMELLLRDKIDIYVIAMDEIKSCGSVCYCVYWYTLYAFKIIFYCF